jgi:hypothetical protein
LFILSYSTVFPSEQEPYVPEDLHANVYRMARIVSDLKAQRWISQSRLLLVPGIFTTALCCSHKKLIEFVQNHPIPFLMLAYLFCNYAIDSFSTYRQIDQALSCFLCSQNMNRYLLSIIAVKNLMQELLAADHQEFDQEHFHDLIAKNTGYTLSGLEKFVSELMQSSVHTINHLCVNIDTAVVEQKMYDLLKERVSIEQMLFVCKNDVMVYPQLCKFCQNPPLEYESTVVKLCGLLHTQLDQMVSKG